MNYETIELKLPVPLAIHLQKTAIAQKLPLADLIEGYLEMVSVAIEERAARGDTATIQHVVRGAA